MPVAEQASALRTTLAASIDATLLRQTRRAERTLAGARVALVVASLCADISVLLFPSLLGGSEWGPSSLVFDAAAVVGSVAFWRWLSLGGWRSWVPAVVSFGDGLTVSAAFALPLALLPPEVYAANVLVGLPVTAAVLVLYGSLRFNRASVWITAAVTSASFLGLAIASSPAMVPLAIAMCVASLLAVAVVADRLTVATRAAVEQEITRTLVARFLPATLVDAAFSDPLSAVGPPQQCEVTVLVTDLRGFTTFAESRSPAEVLAYLSELQGAFADAVEAHGGTVDKFLGDGMLVVFGAPVELPDHAARAVAAAGSVRAAAHRISAERRSRGEPVVGVGIGVHSGAVVAGLLGTGRRLEWTVIGDVVNTASRLESLTKEWGVEVLISGETQRLAQRTLPSVGSSPVRGRIAPIELYTLEPARPDQEH